MNLKRLNRQLNKRYGGAVKAREEDGKRIVSGQLERWEDVVAACRLAVTRKPGVHVINDIRLSGVDIPKARLPVLADAALEGDKPDVLIIGGGISGASIARELSRHQLDILLVDKESDLAMHASGHNDGEVHPGVDLKKGSLKQQYVVRGNRLYDQIVQELKVPFKRCGQFVCFKSAWLRPLIWLYALEKRLRCGVDDTRIISRRALLAQQPHLNPKTRFALANPMAGSVSPYELTIAYAENAVMNGARVSLNTAVTGMTVKEGRIQAVQTNRGTVYPRLVINAAGCFAEDIASLAQDRFYSIHPRKGTDAILDKKASSLLTAVASHKVLGKKTSNSKGGGIVPTVHDNLLVGPDAVETYEKENFDTEGQHVRALFEKQRKTLPALSEREIIAYFAGVRAPTFEEDFIIEPGRRTHNLIHCAGIQSPGLTTAPAVAMDVAAMAVSMLQKEKPVLPNKAFNPVRPLAPRPAQMEAEERDALIRQNPDYGLIICRCEEISKGEILDALHSPIPVRTVDAVKKRARPGMGRCQGGFCSTRVMQILAEELGRDLQQITKGGGDSWVLTGSIGEDTHE